MFLLYGAGDDHQQEFGGNMQTIPEMARADLIADADRAKLKAMANDINFSKARHIIERMSPEDVKTLLFGVFEGAYCTLIDNEPAGMHDSLVDLFTVMQSAEDRLATQAADSRFMERIERTGRFFT